MTRFLARYATYIYAILRIVSGFLFLWHGSQKLLGFPPRQLPPGGAATGGLEPLVAIGGTIELIGGFLILIGLFTGVAAFLASGMMAVAYFMAHFKVDTPLPIANHGELAVIYCFVFLYIASRGSGVWSVDSIFRGSGESNGG